LGAKKLQEQDVFAKNDSSLSRLEKGWISIR